MMEQASCPLPSGPANGVQGGPEGQERVVYFSFFIPSSLRKLFASPKGDRRVLKIEAVCRCLFRLSPMKLSNFTPQRLHLVEAFLDQQLGNFDSCLSMLRALLSSADSGFVLYRAINLKICPNGSYDYRCYCAAADQLPGSVTGALAMVPSADQSDSALSGSTASSTVSQLLSVSEGLARKNRESLAAFVCLEAAVGQLEGIAAHSYGSVIEALFFEAVTGELSAEIWRWSLQQISAGLTQSAVSQLVANCCLVSHSASQLVDNLLETTALVHQLSKDILNDRLTVAWSRTTVESDSSAVKSTRTEFHSNSVNIKLEADDTSAEESSAISVSELLFDDCSGLGSECSRLPPRPAPRLRATVRRQFSAVVSGALLNALFNDCCTVALEEACLDALVVLVSQRLIQSLHKSSRSENQFECRVLKTLARFNSVLRVETSEPDLAGVVDRFFSCVADSLANPDALSAGQVTGLVTALQARPVSVKETQKPAADMGGWQLLRTMREAFERAVCDQMESLSGKTRCREDASITDNGARTDLNYAFKAVGDATSADLDSLSSEASEQPFKRSKATQAKRLSHSLQEIVEITCEEVSDPQLEQEDAMVNQSQPIYRVRFASACSSTTDTVSMAVWQVAAPVKCERRTADGLPDEACLSVLLPSVGHASLASAGCAVVSTTIAVTIEVGPTLHACSTLADGASAGAPIILDLAPAMQTLAKFSLALEAFGELLLLSSCLHWPRQALHMRTPHGTFRSLGTAVSQQSSRSIHCALTLLKTATSHKPVHTAHTGACTVHAPIRPSRSPCCPLSSLALWLPESARRLEFDRCGHAIVGFELAPTAAFGRATTTATTVATAEPLGTSALSMRATASTMPQRLCGLAEPTESSWWLCAPQCALARATANHAAPAWRDGELLECGWAEPSTACLRPMLAAATAAPLARTAIAARPTEAFSSAGGWTGRLFEVAIDDDALNTSAQGDLSNFDRSLAVCWSGPDLVTVPTNSPAVLAPCPALRCGIVDNDDRDTCCGKSVATAMSAVAASAALTVVTDVATESLVSVLDLGKQRRQLLRLPWRSQRYAASSSAAEAGTVRLLRLQAHLDRVRTVDAVNGSV